MKKLLVMVMAALSMSAAHADVKEYSYSCEREPAPANGIWQHYNLTLKLDLENAVLESATAQNKTITGWTYNPESVQTANSIDTPDSGHAPTIAAFDHPLPNDDNLQIVVYGATGGVKVADVIFISTFKSGDWCYRLGSQKEQFMTSLREEHNNRILKGQ